MEIKALIASLNEMKTSQHSWHTWTQFGIVNISEMKPNKFLWSWWNLKCTFRASNGDGTPAWLPSNITSRELCTLATLQRKRDQNQTDCAGVIAIRFLFDHQVGNNFSIFHLLGDWRGAQGEELRAPLHTQAQIIRAQNIHFPTSFTNLLHGMFSIKLHLDSFESQQEGIQRKLLLSKKFKNPAGMDTHECRHHQSSRQKRKTKHRHFRSCQHNQAFAPQSDVEVFPWAARPWLWTNETLGGGCTSNKHRGEKTDLVEKFSKTTTCSAGPFLITCLLLWAKY